MTYHSASCAIVGEDITLDDGKAIAEGLLSQFGFTDFQFRPDEKKSKYYTPETQTEVYAYHPKLKEWLEVATFGIYSPIALSKYNINVPVMNLGLGVERLAMINHNYDDVRKMVYPQFYEQTLSDRDIAYSIKVDYMEYKKACNNPMTSAYDASYDGFIRLTLLKETSRVYMCQKDFRGVLSVSILEDMLTLMRDDLEF